MRRLPRVLLLVSDKTERVTTGSPYSRDRQHSRLYGLGDLAATGRLEASAREHTELLDVLASGNPVATVEFMRHHPGHVRGSWAGRPEQPRANPGKGSRRGSLSRR